MSSCSQPLLRKLLSLLVAAVLFPSARAADEPPPEENVFRDNTAEVLQGAAALAGAGCPDGHGGPLVIGLLIRGDQRHLWKLQNDKALPLRTGLLKHVKDSTGVMIDDSAFEVEAYCEALWKASLVPLGALANSARTDVTFAHLHGEPKKYRGDVIHFAGQLRRIRRFDPPAMVESKGIRDLYECWFFDTHYGVNPVCLVCSELPEGARPGEHLDLEGSFDAYFFKWYRYKAADSKAGQAREAPLFIGRSFVLAKQPAAATEDAYAQSGKTVLLVFLGLVLATFVLAFGLHWWFRRADRRVQARIREVRAREYVEPGASNRPGATPSAN